MTKDRTIYVPITSPVIDELREVCRAGMVKDKTIEQTPQERICNSIDLRSLEGIETDLKAAWFV